MQHQRLFVPGPVGKLQAIHEPSEDARAAVVICHPHPQFGGTMRNKVVYEMSRTFAEAGCATLRFNFRGVEGSEGAWDEARGEVDDVRAAIEWMEVQYPDTPLWLAGFSFGAYVGLKAAQGDARIERLFAVAPAVNHWDFSFMQLDSRPLTVVAGKADEIVPFEKVVAWAQSLSHVQFHPVEGAGHFFPDHMQKMKRMLLK